MRRPALKRLGYGKERTVNRSFCWDSWERSVALVLVRISPQRCGLTIQFSSILPILVGKAKPKQVRKLSRDKYCCFDCPPNNIDPFTIPSQGRARVGLSLLNH